jgi:exopolysaccharide biosynthesis polyprenyl glycosylphosphotransferase
MNATTERTALLQGMEVYEELRDTVGDQTLEILDRRRRTAVVRRRGWLVHRMLLLADLAGLVAAFATVEWLSGIGQNAIDRVNVTGEFLIFGLSLPGWILVTKFYGLYDQDEERTDHSTTDDVLGVFHMVTVCAWLFFGFTHITGLAYPSIPKLLLFWALAIGLVSVGRVGARAYCRRNINYLQNTIIVGAGDVGQLIARKLLKHPEYGINLVGFVDAEPKERRGDLEHLTILGSPAKLPALVRVLDVERVIVAFSSEGHESMLDLVRSLKELEVQVDLVPRLFELVGPGIGVHTVEGLPLVGLPPTRLSPSSRFLKRSLDLVASVIALGVLSPLFAIIGLAIRLDSSGPVFFRQTRMGKGGETFQILKFRTMAVDAEERKGELAHLNKHLGSGGDPRMFKVPDDPRVSRVGRVLRRYSIDELPQLINVVRGEMSLVGPRPLILAEDQHVVDWRRRRLSMKPGITGLWQVYGRDDIPFEEMVELDYKYVAGWSLLTDLKLLLRTLPAVARVRSAH